MIKTTQQAEIERVQAKDRTWALFASDSMAAAAHKAKELGWKNKEVQVRTEHIPGAGKMYFVEPFERDCGCPHILKYSDFFE